MDKNALKQNKQISANSKDFYSDFFYDNDANMHYSNVYLFLKRVCTIFYSKFLSALKNIWEKTV